MLRRHQVLDPRGHLLLGAWDEPLTWRHVLYVGANPKRFNLHQLCSQGEIYVLEVWPPYVEALRDPGSRWPVTEVIEGDVRYVDRHVRISELAPFEAVVWWHGPEHVERRDAARLLRPGGVLEGLWERSVLIGCPWGVMPQEPIDGNLHQAHQSTWWPEDFAAWGYNVQTRGRRSMPGGHISAWKTADRRGAAQEAAA